MDGFPFLDIVFFAMLAVFLVLRLRSVLGRRTGVEKRRPNPLAPAPVETNRDNVIALPERDRRLPEMTARASDTPLGGVLLGIKEADPSFEEAEFLSGARMAFEMILGAYARADLAQLRPLLNEAVFGNFKDATDQRLAAKHSLETTLVGIVSAEIADARMDGRTAMVTVKFVTEQVNVTKDAEGRIIEGDPQHVETITDLWTFARDTASRDPNWTLVETRSPH
ncbi:MAG: Tim44 domain-containing protein [Proteobacteria bacterium]|nr:Tim44 domain-containing protein [Pseudomonadota bacterium]